MSAIELSTKVVATFYGDSDDSDDEIESHVEFVNEFIENNPGTLDTLHKLQAIYATETLAYDENGDDVDIKKIVFAVALIACTKDLFTGKVYSEEIDGGAIVISNFGGDANGYTVANNWKEFLVVIARVCDILKKNNIAARDGTPLEIASNYIDPEYLPTLIENGRGIYFE